MMCSWSTHVMVARVEQVDRGKNVIVYRKLRDLKGRWPAEVIRHAFAPTLPERPYIMQWAEPGKTAVLCALESYKWGHTYIDGQWYAASTTNWQGWVVSHGEPVLLRTYSGKAERLASAAAEILAGKEVVVTCLAGDNLEELRQRRAKVQRMRAGLKRTDYNPRRDFVAWGGDDFTEATGMPGFSRYSPLPRSGADAQAIACADFDGDGRPDLCLSGAARVVLLRNHGDFFTEVPLPGLVGGCRAAVWADYNGDGKPDLLLATPAGPKLYTNLGGGSFRDDSALLPREPAYNLTAAAWIDYDGDGKPDVLLGNGFHGLRLYRNKGPAPAGAPAGAWFEDVSARVGLGADGVGGSLKGDTLTVCDVDGDGPPDFLYGADTGLLVLNTPTGFVEAKDAGVVYQPGGVGPVFGDFDNDGHPDLFVPQPGGGKLFRNDGRGRFTDVTAHAGLDRLPAAVTCAAWGDLDNDGHLDLVVGCLRGPNRFFRNKGDGTFEDATEAVGLDRRIFNTQAVCLVDLNNDGVLDAVFNNEGQDSAALLGKPVTRTGRTPVVLRVEGADGVVGSRVRVLDRQGRLHGSRQVSGGDGRGGQAPACAHFALAPGAYRIEVRYSSGLRRAREITVAGSPLRAVIDDRTPRAD
jgi:hypothetical protein